MAGIVQYSTGMASSSSLPAAALNWLLGATSSTVATVESTPYVLDLTDNDYHVTVVDDDLDSLKPLRYRRPMIRVVAAHGEALPFEPTCFDRVIAIQSFHTMDPRPTLAEWARVLRPDGQVGLVFIRLDDSVPMIRRLKNIIGQALPRAMAADRGVSSVDHLHQSSLFYPSEQRSWRLWQTCTRSQLVATATAAPGADRLDSNDLHALGDAVGELYDTHARVPEPLRLPYTISCWRATVKSRAAQTNSPATAAGGSMSMSM
jgi:SAM-dependent methyltransferase